MKYVLAILIFDGHKFTLIDSSFYLEDFPFFARPTLKEFMIFGAKEISKKLEDNKLYMIEFDKEHKELFAKHGFEDIRCCSYSYSNELVNKKYNFSVIVNNYNYPRVISLIFKDINKYLFDIKNENQEKMTLSSIMQKYEEPEKYDKIEKIKNNLEETKQIIMTSIDKIIDRGDKIEDLVKKTDDLSMQAKTFSRSAKKLNKCCIIL